MNTNRKSVKEKVKIVVPLDNDFVKSTMKVFNLYLIECVTGSDITADLRLQKRLEAIKLLHADALKEISILCFGRFDDTNIELILTKGGEL